MAPAKKRKTPTPQLEPGESVSVNRNGVKHLGTVHEFDESSNMVAVDFSTEETPDIPLMLVPLRDVTKAKLTAVKIDPSTTVHPSQQGFHQYEIEWRDAKGEALHFTRKEHDNPRGALRCKAVVEGVVFSGFINKTRVRDSEEVWQILLYANYEGTPYSLPAIVYDKDPRIPGSTEVSGYDDVGERANWDGMRDLNSDICVAINRWLHFHAGGNIQTIDDLRCKAKHPRIKVTSFEQLEGLITELTNLYNASARSGGFRSAFLQDAASGVTVCVEAELTSEVIKSYHTEQHIGAIRPALTQPGESGPVDDGIERPKDLEEALARRPKPHAMKPHADLATKTTDDLLDLKNELQQTPKRERSADQLKLERAIREELRKRR